jgi:alpha-glucuronidase
MSWPKAVLLILAFCAPSFSETGYDAWLRYRPRYQPIKDTQNLPATLLQLDNSEVVTSAQTEMIRGVRGMLGRTLRVARNPADEDMIVLGVAASVRKTFPGIAIPADLIPDGYWIKDTIQGRHRVLLITASNDRGVLYGAFELLRALVLQQRLNGIDRKSNPYQPIRWVNEWNNFDGSIERGYAGRSIFFSDGNVVSDLTRAGDYARLLASVGINGCTVNNVNANPKVLTPEFLTQLSRIAAVFRPWGVKLSISVPFSSPKTVGGLESFDPADARVQAWWKTKVDEVYRVIPDLGGFVVKADSEGQLGPSTYGRSHAQAANVLAEALRPHGGIVIYRGFVYNHHLDWRDLKNDRAKAAYDNFHELDGKFADNAILQIKYGPIDFQAREPVSPLLGSLPHTNEAMELQITQEYTGQQRHLCYLVPIWKQVLDFDLHANGEKTPVHSIVSGKVFNRPLGGLVGVSNVGLDQNWMGADLAMANLYGFGRLAWNPELSADQITQEWTTMTWGQDAQVNKTVTNLELESWHVYESYTGPLGIGTLTDILHGHYGPGIETAERNGWGQWIRADHEGIGMDRAVATGTGFIGQYSPEVAREYELLERCPDNLLLFMHHVPYKYVLHSGKTMIQDVYDSHYAGAAEAQTFPEQWKALRGKVDEQRYDAVLARLEYQAGHAIVWRDAICQWFLRESGIADEQGRVGHYPNRIEAEDMQLHGYQVIDITPWEDASAGRAVSCPQPSNSCSATTEFKGPAGWYDVRVQYFDTTPGNARFQLCIGDQLVKDWTGNADLPWKTPNGDTSTRAYANGLALRPGDKVRILGTPDREDSAAIDYIEIQPQH